MAQTIEITIDQGKLQGSIVTDFLGNKYYSFKGIPYAKPPVGELRFKAPVPLEKWTGTWDATKEGNANISRDVFSNGEIIGNEDCLVINVFTKHVLFQDHSNKLLPVLFWIHGGGFIWGSSSSTWYSPDFLITENVVVVSVNYRLGMLGFLSLEDPSVGVPGNNGLKDIVLSLKWVQDNIKKFGGNPENVTIFGESAGAAAVHYLITAPKANGLFHKAILQSGCAIDYWSAGRRTGDEIATVIGLEGADDKAILEFLLQQPVEKIFEIQGNIKDTVNRKNGRPFGVVVEYDNPDALITEEVIETISKGKYNKVPVIVGYNSSEGMFMDLLSRDVVDVNIPKIFGYQHDDPKIEEIKNEILKFYYGDGKPSLENKTAKYAAVTDFIVLPVYHTVLAHVSTSNFPVYFYKMTIQSNLNFMKNKIGIKEQGVCHCDDLGYLFKNIKTPEIVPDSIEDLGWRKFVKLWTNFAKYGNPTPDINDSLLKVEWKPAEKNLINYLEIGENLRADVNPDLERINFWNKLFLESPGSEADVFAFLKPAILDLLSK